MLDTITYNRSARRYELVDEESGEIFTFPPGKDGKAQAFRFSVELFAPDLFAAANRIIAKFPYLDRRVWSAVSAVASGAVHIHPELENDAGIIARVDGSEGLGAYNIRQTRGFYSCECEDFQLGNAPLTPTGQSWCYHILALRLHLQTQEQPY